MKKLIQFIESERFVYSCTLSILAVQILQTAHLFHRVSKLNLDVEISSYNFAGFSWLHSLLCTFAIEAAVLMLIVNGRAFAAKWYAAASFASSILYFGHWEHFYYGGWQQHLPAIIASSLFSAMLAGSVLFFSELFAEKLVEHKANLLTAKANEQSATEDELSAEQDREIYRLLKEQNEQDQRARLTKHTVSTEQVAQSPTEQHSDEQSKSDPFTPGLRGLAALLPADQIQMKSSFTCPECRRTFASQKALNGHMRSHAKELIPS